MKPIVISKWGKISCGYRVTCGPLELICWIALFTPLVILGAFLAFTHGDSNSYLLLIFWLFGWTWCIAQLVIAWPRPCVVFDDTGITECGQESKAGDLIIPWECIDGVDLTHLDAWVMYLKLANKQECLNKLSPMKVDKDTSIWTISLKDTNANIDRICKFLRQKQIPVKKFS